MSFVRLASDNTIVTANYNVQVQDSIVRVDASNGPVTVTLPAIASARGNRYVVRKEDATSNAVTVQAQAGETIDSSSSVQLMNQNDAVTFYAPLTGTKWVVFNAGGTVLLSTTVLTGVLLGASACLGQLLNVAYGVRV